MAVIRLGMQGHTEALVTPQGVEDRFGDPASAGVSYWVPGCLLAPQRTGGTNVNTHGAEFRAHTTVAEWALYAPLGFEFPLGSTVEIDGLELKVAAPAEKWAESGQVVPLRRVTG